MLVGLIFGGVIGAIIGWNTKQPEAVATFVAKVKAKLGA